MSSNTHRFYQRATFLISAGKPSQLPEDYGYEVAFAGRSNAGKSSALNALTGQRNLARTSKTPGRTQLINLFSLDEQRRLVDLPGYGFAKVPPAVKEQWVRSMEGYLRQRESLVGLILLMDVRHPLKDYDQQMIEWCQQAQMPVHVLLTKADKLKFGPASATLQKVRATLKKQYPEVTVQLFSATARTGLEEAWTQLDAWLQVAPGSA